ncbi:hypothetical protein PF008_g5512 [Phytophthora fragariae]|uniref:Uncharacterized protein n=1 Tax=Phytophthora fragariae TaxID=53985 RepID=A0A6G0S957_9STRA|nr:hypothetical protein PF008_g5512 [Phytophthora fragariae]
MTRGPRDAELPPHGTALAAVKKATIGRLDDEIKGRDEGRAAQYVATVRPTKADTRYVRPDQKLKVSKADGRDLGGEGDEPTEDQIAAGEGDEASTPKGMVTGTALETTTVATVPGFSSDMTTVIRDVTATTSPSATPGGEEQELTGVAAELATVVTDEGETKRKVLGPARRESEKRRAARADVRAKTKARLAKEAELAAVMKATTATLRQLQTEESRAVLAARRAQQMTDGASSVVPSDKKVHCGGRRRTAHGIDGGLRRPAEGEAG